MASVRSPLPPKNRAAFSLVEVTLALGVVAVSLLSLIGLLPAGLTSLRESMDQTVHAQIVQRIAAGAGASDFASLKNETLSFDAEGQMVTGREAPVRYQAVIQESAPSLPGLTGEGEVAAMSGHLKRLRIGISRPLQPNTPAVWYAIQVAAR